MADETKKDGREKTIFINKKKYETTADRLTGTQVLELAQLSPDQYDLYLVKGDGKSEQIGPQQEVEIKDGLHFNAVTKGINFG